MSGSLYSWFFTWTVIASKVPTTRSVASETEVASESLEDVTQEIQLENLSGV